MKKLVLSAFLLTIGSVAAAQEDSGIKFSGYLETYLGYDLNKPADHNRPAFIYSHNRHNEVNLNLGWLKGSYTSENLRASLALMAGTYPNANLAAEPGVLKNVYEASAGLKLSSSANLWLDAGIFSSHIGFESAVSKDCWALTRGIAAENTPYYESGIKISYITPDGDFSATVLYLNGWQRINRQNGNSQPAGGVQLTWKPAAGLTLNYSNYLGTEGADSIRVRRFYHNFYGIYQLTERFGLTAGLDYGSQQKVRGKKGSDHIWAPVAIARYQLSTRWAMAARLEHYQDKHGIFIATGTANGFNTTGYSINLDYSPLPNAVIRLEGKLYDSKDKQFTRNLEAVNSDAVVTGSFAVSF